VFLYTGSGAPIDIPGTDPNRRVLVTLHNDPIFNAFPIRYYDPGTLRVSHPSKAQGR